MHEPKKWNIGMVNVIIILLSTVHSGYVGMRKTKRSAINVLNKIEKGVKGNKLEFVEIRDDHNEGNVSILYESGKKHKGAVILYRKGDEVSKAHEVGHYTAGHHLLGKTPKYSEELEASGHAIKFLDSKNVYNRKARNRIINALATHVNRRSSKVSKANIGKATKDIKKVEASLGIIR